MLKIIFPLIFAVVAILQDAHILVDYDGCTKDNQLLAILIFLALATLSRKLVVQGFWWMLILLQGAFFLGDTYISNFLPDTWSATEARLFEGYPLIQVGSLLAVSGLAFAGYMRRQVMGWEALKCLLGMVLIIISAQLWIIGDKNVEKSPWRGWNSYEKTERIVMTSQDGQFIGNDWVLRNTDYGRTMMELKSFWGSSDHQHYFVAPRQGYSHPFIYKLVRTDTRQIILEAQARDMEWGEDMVWIWEYVMSFILVFFETFMITHTLQNLLLERKDLRRTRDIRNL
ncbi:MULTISPECIES: hypothetical protein [Pseudomonas]|uniref:hypothetical protein n=1 Tax=Pseudomonas TaxID=286 RepID=UPI000F0281F1|nr:hypothetical protein [Pseudomonas viridiflava]MBD8614852.1 hypothetical protein [Pseudomonas putida]MBD8681464.1 hypothetical protein [Pseudomonas sp. CFBP 13719]